MEYVKVKVVLPDGSTKTGKIDASFSEAEIEASILQTFELDPKKFTIRQMPAKEHFYNAVLVIDETDF
ncbi:MAG: hypothetical protein CV087_09755 [Candidatus Brocadia sp. WS118]|nr:MAG: hypothetical protein CV087_09755 [Candidatus Brocadia sp. WS118]